MHSDELTHHGILGQKWGQRNGPPYPLDSKISTGSKLKTAGDAIKKSVKKFDDAVAARKQAKAEKKEAEEREKIRQTVAKSDAKEIDKIKDKLSTKEFEEAVRRAELNKRLQNADTSKTKLQKITHALNTVTKLTGAGIGAWNNFAKISNTFLDSDLPVIGEKKDKDKKKKSEDKSQSEKDKKQEEERQKKEEEKKKKKEERKEAVKNWEETSNGRNAYKGYVMYSDESWPNNDYRYYLAHHGILGQKWGQKNGPPYPLDAGDHSASEKKAGWRKSLGGVFKKKKKQNPELDDLKDNKQLNKALSKSGVENPEEAINKSIDAAKKMTDDITDKYFNDSKEQESEKDISAKEAVLKEATKDCWNPDFRKMRDDPKEKERADKAADLGLKAIEKLRGPGYVDEDGDVKYFMEKEGWTEEKTRKFVHDSNREWFLFEDQTIGLPMIADLVNQGYSSDKISSLIDTVNNNRDFEEAYDNPYVFNIQESNWNNENKRFAKACEELKDKK